MTKLIDLMIDEDIKSSELKILKLIDEKSKLRISHLVSLASWYQIKEIIPKLEKLGMIIKEIEKKEKVKEIEWIKLNYQSKVIKILFNEIEENVKLKESIKGLTERGLKYQIQELIKSQDKNEGISYDDIFQELLNVGNKNLTYGEVEEIINNLLVDGWAYESKPKILRYLG